MSRHQGKYVIGLTGNIAVGKSVVRQMLQHLGAYTIDADSLSHQAMAPGAPAYIPTIEMFGKLVLSDDGTINRAMLGSIVFAVPEALAKLEAIIHPVVTTAASALISRAKQPIIVIEAIKLLESENLMGEVDTIWVVDASPETQLRRMVDKRKMGEDEARKRIFAQRSQAEKLRRASVVVTNDGSVDETWKQVQAGWNEMQRLIKPPQAPPTTSMPKIQPIATSAASPAPAAAPMAAAAPAPAATPTIQPLRPATGTLRSGTGTLDAATQPPAAGAANLHIRRGMPTNAEQIAQFVSRVSGRTTSRLDIMLAFGQKSFVLASDDQNGMVGVIGWQVENLITRVDEFYVDASVAREPVVRALINVVEDASRELQSEVCFIHLLPTTPVDVVQAYLNEGYNFLKMEEVKFPAWREAAREMTTDNSQALMKQLRADRVMKPI